MMKALTFFFAAVVVTAAILVAFDVVGVVAQLVVLGALVVGALGPRCGGEPKNRGRFQQEACGRLGVHRVKVRVGLHKRRGRFSYHPPPHLLPIDNYFISSLCT